jgi:hypothetical protein
MLHEEQGQTACILNAPLEWTMPCKELQVQGLPDEELEYCLMKRPVVHYRHAKES